MENTRRGIISVGMQHPFVMLPVFQERHYVEAVQLSDSTAIPPFNNFRTLGEKKKRLRSLPRKKRFLKEILQKSGS